MNRIILFLDDAEQVAENLPEEAENLFKFIYEKLHYFLTTPLGQILGISGLGTISLGMILYVIWKIYKNFVLEGKNSKILKTENEELRDTNRKLNERVAKLETKQAQNEADFRTIYKFNTDVGYITHNSRLKEAAQFRYNPILPEETQIVEQTTTYLVKRKGKKKKHHHKKNFQQVKQVIDTTKEVVEEVAKEV